MVGYKPTKAGGLEKVEETKTHSPPERTQPCQYLDFSPVKPTSDCDFQNAMSPVCSVLRH